MSKVVNGIMWSAIERLSVQGIQFLLTIIIARVLLPSDFGLIAMLGIFIAVAQSIVDSGFSSALIQKQNRTEVDFSTVFYFNLVISIIVYTLLFLASPFISEFYNQPQLTLITRIVGINLIINSFSIVQISKLTINLNFRLQATASLSSVIVSGVLGVYMAYAGYGVWALVIQTLSRNIINALMLWIVARWRPQLVFSVESFKELFSYGSKLIIAGIIHTLYANMYTLIIGKKYNSLDVGLYSNANNLTTLVGPNITQIIHKVIFPKMCNLNSDQEKVDLLNQTIKACCYLIFPFSLALCVLAEPFIRVVLTEKWLPSVRFIQILSISSMFMPLLHVHLILKAKGFSGLILKTDIIKKIVGVSYLFIFMPFGIEAMCWGALLYSISDMLIIFYYTNKIIHYPLLTALYELRKILILNAVTTLVMIIVSMSLDNVYLKLFISSSIGVLSYILLSRVLKLNELKVITNLVTNLKK